MFYNSDILSRRKSGLGIIWLAATLGNKNAVRRLSRKDILAVNVSKACLMVRSPTEPMALRLSSQLLYGVVKIYHQQTEIWMQDVANTHSNIRKDLTAISDPIFGVIDMPKHAARNIDAITMRLDLSTFALDFDQDLTAFYDTLILRDISPLDIEAERFRAATPVSARFIASEEQITLPGRVYDEDVGIGRLREDEQILPTFDGNYEDQYDNLDLGLDLPVTPVAPFPENTRQSLGPLPDRLGDSSPSIGSASAAWSRMGDRTGLGGTQMDLQLDLGPPITPARRPHEFADEEGEVEALLGPARNRPRLASRLDIFQDSVVELTDEQLRDQRATYNQRMWYLREGQQQKRAERAADRSVRVDVFGPRIYMQESPSLLQLWYSTAGACFSDIQERYRRLRLQVEREELRSASSASQPDFPQPDFLPARSDDSFEDLGVPRAEQNLHLTEVKHARESLPWNMYMAERRRSSVAPSLLNIAERFEREETPLQLAFDQSLGTPLDLRSQTRQRQAPSLAAGHLTPSTAIGFDEFLFPAPGTPSVTGSGLIRPLQALSTQHSPGPFSRPRQGSSVVDEPDDELRQETRNFLEYSCSVRDELADPKGFLFFGDLAPVASSRPEVAAQAFYHTLALASISSFRVRQDQPYQEIQIAIAT